MKGEWFFDSQVSEATTEDMNYSKLALFLKAAAKKRRVKLRPGTNPEAALKKLGLFADGRLRNAAVLMFCDTPRDFRINSEIRCARLRGVDLTSPYMDIKTFSGPLFEQIDQSEGFISEVNKRRQKGRPEYPIKALKEALINAVAHRDYMSASPSQVRIFDDRAEVVSPGGLPEGLTPRKMKTGTLPRNPLISRLLYLMGYMELKGKGTRKMAASCRKHALPSPEFEDDGSSFVVRFRKHRVTPELLHRIKAHERHHRAMDYIKVVRKLSHQDYQRLAGATREEAERDLGHLVRRGVLKKIEKEDVTYYVLKH